MSIEFFVSTESELAEIQDTNELFDLLFQYNICASGAMDFKTVRAISNFFVKNEDFVPTKAIKTQYYIDDSGRSYRVNIYKFDKIFTNGVAKFEIEKLDNKKAIEYWQSRGYFSMGTWNAVYGLHNLCKFAVRDNKNVFIFEEINESNLEK